MLTAACIASAQSAPVWTWGAEVGFNARYVWRGQAYSKGPVAQPWIWATRNRDTFTVWSSMVLNNEPHRGRLDQVYFSAAREIARGAWKFEPGFQGYHWHGFGGQNDVTTFEGAVRISHPLGPAGFFTSHTLDVANYRGAWIGDAGIEWKRTMRGWQWEASGLVAVANAAFLRAYADVNQSAVNNAQANLSSTRRLSRGWYVRIHAEFVVVVSPAVRRAVDPRNIPNAGLAVGREF